MTYVGCILCQIVSWFPTTHTSKSLRLFFPSERIFLSESRTSVSPISEGHTDWTYDAYEHTDWKFYKFITFTWDIWLDLKEVERIVHPHILKQLCFHSTLGNHLASENVPKDFVSLERLQNFRETVVASNKIENYNIAIRGWNKRKGSKT